MKIAPPPLRRASREPDTIAPDGSEVRLLATTAEGATRASLCEVRLCPGAVSRPVAHHCFTSSPWPGPDEARPAEWGELGEPTV